MPSTRQVSATGTPSAASSWTSRALTSRQVSGEAGQAPKDFRLDWLVFRELVRCPDVAHELALLPARVQEAARDRAIAIDESPLRLLDAALWTHTVWAI